MIRSTSLFGNNAFCRLVIHLKRIRLGNIHNKTNTKCPLNHSVKEKISEIAEEKDGVDAAVKLCLCVYGVLYGI